MVSSVKLTIANFTSKKKQEMSDLLSDNASLLDLHLRSPSDPMHAKH